MGLGSAVCVRDLRIARPDLTHCSASITNNEWHSGTRCRMLWCVPFAPATLFIPSSVLSLFFLYIPGFISAALVWFGVYPLIPILLCWLCAIFHTSVSSSCISYVSGSISAANILLPFSAKTSLLMFSLYLSMKVDYRLKHRPVI